MKSKKSKEKKKNEVIAEMTQKKTPNGRIYFIGSFPNGGGICMFKTTRFSKSGDPMWELVLKREFIA